MTVPQLNSCCTQMLLLRKSAEPWEKTARQSPKKSEVICSFKNLAVWAGLSTTVQTAAEVIFHASAGTVPDTGNTALSVPDAIFTVNFISKSTAAGFPSPP